MRILQVKIENFRGIAEAVIKLGQRTLLVGENNAGKTTVLEALNLVLGPERVGGPETINEHDFYEGKYTPLQTPGEGSAGGQAETAPEIRIEVILEQLRESEMSRFRDHLELWSSDAGRPYEPEEIDPGTEAPTSEVYVLRVGFRGWFDPEEDEFKCETFFCSSVSSAEGARPLGKRDKQRIGFLYLRSLRTASRAASLQRGSLLDILLDLKGARPKVWESVLAKLYSLGDELEADQSFHGVLTDLERRIQKYLPRPSGERWRNTLYVSDLTRRELRGVMTYFLESAPERHPLPYDRLGSGTTNILVLALLSAIAEIKDNVIFAMEEPEIAIAPYTQRRIVQEVFKLSRQTIITSHSPYIAERFLDHTILVMRRSLGGVVSASTVQDAEGVNPKRLRQDFRLRYAEGILGGAVLLTEGISDRAALTAVNRSLVTLAGSGYVDLDILGTTIIAVDGKDELPKVAKFFRSLGVRVFVLSDAIDAALKGRIEEFAEWCLNLTHSSLEKLLASDCSNSCIRNFLRGAQERPDFPGNITLPPEEGEDSEWAECLKRLLSTRKGDEYAALFLDGLELSDFPESLLRMLAVVSSRVQGVLFKREDPLFALVGQNAPDRFEPLAEHAHAATDAHL